jgi:phospholipid/cholesterol/gamma-HCH transport system substrate-binding protein
MADPAQAIDEARGSTLRAKLLLGLLALLIGGFIAYVMLARGVFEPTQKLVLVVENAEGLSVGADLTYSGFAIGRVQKIELAPDGRARAEVSVPKSQAHWLRATSVFTLERGLVGAARLRAFTGDRGAPPLPDGAERTLLRGDAAEEIPVVLNGVKGIVQNIERLTAAESDISASIAALRALAEKMNGRNGVVGALVGNRGNAEKVMEAIANANRLLDSLNGLSQKLGGTLATAEQALNRLDQRLLSPGGAMDEAQKTLAELHGTIAEARASLRRVDGVLADAQKISSNAAGATQDLGLLRAEVENNLRKIGSLVNEINRKWPFSRETETPLP